LIEHEGYMYVCGKYIEHNPVKAGMVEQAQDWQYSSAKYYEGLEQDNLIDAYNKGEVLKNIDVSDCRFFERGWLIGSERFKYKKLKGVV